MTATMTCEMDEAREVVQMCCSLSRQEARGVVGVAEQDGYERNRRRPLTSRNLNGRFCTNKILYKIYYIQARKVAETVPCLWVIHSARIHMKFTLFFLKIRSGRRPECQSSKNTCCKINSAVAAGTCTSTPMSQKAVSRLLRETANVVSKLSSKKVDGVKNVHEQNHRRPGISVNSVAVVDKVEHWKVRELCQTFPSAKRDASPRRRVSSVLRLSSP